jgi:hypothetical protein
MTSVHTPDPNQSSSDSPTLTGSNLDIERSTLKASSLQGVDTKPSEEVVEGLAGPQASGSTAHLVGQEDDFVEGGLEGWRAVLGCALVIGVTGGTLIFLYLVVRNFTIWTHVRLEVGGSIVIWLNIVEQSLA